MSDSPAASAIPAPAALPSTKSMEDIVSLCKRRGFVYPASEIYGGINGFWDYGPLGVQLKNNIRDSWWREMVECPPDGPDGQPLSIVGLDSSIIQNPKVWEASGHVGGFNDPMVDDKETKQRFRADHLQGLFRDFTSKRESNVSTAGYTIPLCTVVASSPAEAAQIAVDQPKMIRPWRITRVEPWDARRVRVAMTDKNGESHLGLIFAIESAFLEADPGEIPSPFSGKQGSLTEPRQFNLMFETYVGAIKDEDNKAYLRPETAQGIFLNYKNVLDTMRVKVPFGIAQVGKAFRNEVTPRNFIFRSREFEQMEMEWFCHESEAPMWFEFWRDQRMNWYKSIGLSTDNLLLRTHEQDELSHYAKEGEGTVDIEYRWPFTSPGYGELEGIAHRGNFDLTAHAEAAGAKLEYFDQEAQVKAKNEGLDKDEINKRSKYMPHVIEPAAGLTRATLAVLCEAYTPDDSRASKMFMKFNPKLAPIQAAIFPLVNKDGMPEVASKLYRELRTRFRVQTDAKQSIGKRYARMDEAGTPYCFTIDGDTLTDQTITVRDRDTGEQERIGIDKVGAFLAEHVGA